jgi:hypothetical protein
MDAAGSSETLENTDGLYGVISHQTEITKIFSHNHLLYKQTGISLMYINNAKRYTAEPASTVMLILSELRITAFIEVTLFWDGVNSKSHFSALKQK